MKSSYSAGIFTLISLFTLFPLVYGGVSRKLRSSGNLGSVFGGLMVSALDAGSSGPGSSLAVGILSYSN